MLRGEGVIQVNNNGYLTIRPANISGYVMLPGHKFPNTAAVVDPTCPLVGTENLFNLGFDPRNHLDAIDTVEFTGREMLAPDLKTVGIILLSISGEKCKDCILVPDCKAYQNHPKE